MEARESGERKKERKKDERQGNGTHKDAQAVTKEYIVQVKYQGAQSWSLPTKIGGMMVVSKWKESVTYRAR